MVTEQSIRDFINGDIYNSLLEHLCEVRDVEINRDEPSAVILKHDANRLNLSGFSLADIADVLKGNLSGFITYVCLKFDEFLSVEDEQEGNDDKDKIIKTLPFYKNFLMLYAIEFCFLVKNIDGLDDYLKKIRVPHSKKYSLKLKKIFSFI